MDVDQDFEYCVQLFRFNTHYFMKAIKSLVKEEVALTTESMTATLLKKYASDDPEVEKVKTATKSLINQYISASVEPLSLLENQLKELIRVPPHVLLPQDTPQRTQYSAEDETEVDKQVSDLMLRLKRTKTFDVELQKELKELRDILPLLKNRVLECKQFVSEFEEADRNLNDLVLDTEEMVTEQLEFLNINKDL